MKISEFFRKKSVKNVLSVLSVIVIGFILLNLTFLLDTLFQNVLRWIIGRFIELGPETKIIWLPFLMHGLFLVLIAAISYFVFKSKLKTIYKATYLVVPTATFLVTLGIMLYSIPWLLYTLGFLICLAVLYIFYRKNLPWLYYFSFILISIALMFFTLLGGEI